MLLFIFLQQVFDINHFVSGRWGEGVQLEGFPFNPRYVTVIRVIVEEEGFRITANAEDLYLYPYARPVEEVHDVVVYTQDDDPENSIHAALQSGTIYQRGHL